VTSHCRLSDNILLCMILSSGEVLNFHYFPFARTKVCGNKWESERHHLYHQRLFDEWRNWVNSCLEIQQWNMIIVLITHWFIVYVIKNVNAYLLYVGRGWVTLVLISVNAFAPVFFFFMRGCWWVLSPTRKETSYSDQTRDLFNILPTKLNTLLSPLL